MFPQWLSGDRFGACTEYLGILLCAQQGIHGEPLLHMVEASLLPSPGYSPWAPR